MRNEPIKLTDEVIAFIADCVDDRSVVTAARVETCLRTLRDRAQTLVATATPWTDRNGKVAEVDVAFEAFNALREVLP